MPSFVSPVIPANVRREADVLFLLPSPTRNASDAGKIVRSGVARYEYATLLFMQLVPAPNTGSFQVLSPVRGSTRHVNRDIGLGPITELLEISPLPFSMQSVLKGFHRGVPTFYLGGQNFNLPPEDTVLTAGEQLGNATSLFFSILFQDRVTLSPRGSIQLLLDAMNQAGEEDTDSWEEFGQQLYAGLPRSILVLNESKVPQPGIEFTTVPASSEGRLTSDANGLIAIPTDLTDFTLRQSIPLPPPSNPSNNFPILSIYEGNADTSGSFLDFGTVLPAGQGVLFSSDFAFGHLQISDARNWFAPRTPGTNATLSRFHANSRLEPLIDGEPMFKRIADDLLACRGQGCGAHMAGWAFENFAISQRPFLDPSGNLLLEDTTLFGFANFIRDNGGGMRFLANRFNLIRSTENLAQLFIKATLLFCIAAIPYFFFRLYLYGLEGASALLLVGFDLALVLLPLELMFMTQTLDSLTNVMLPILLEVSRHFVNRMADTGHAVVFSPHPAQVIDNPAGMPQTITYVTDNEKIDFGPIWNQFGVYHQKLQVIKRSVPDSDGNLACAYIGGMDFHHTRVDDPGHHGRATLDRFKRQAEDTGPDAADAMELVRLENVAVNVPYHPFHDVHSRITGPAVKDAAITFEERYNHDRSTPENIVGDPLAVEPVFTPDDLVLPDQSAKHIIQIGRTYFRAAPLAGDGSPPDPARALPFAPLGESTTYETLLNALDAANEFIYIEDQYFTPNDSRFQNQRTYLDLLCDKAASCKRLMIVVPGDSDKLQLFGDARRLYAFERLRRRWRDRVFIGALRRRPVLEFAGKGASSGRCYLAENAEVNAVQLSLTPVARVPTQFPFWLWINGELMLATSAAATSDDKVVRVNVARGSTTINPLYGAVPRSHKAQAPVTLSALKSIYVHSKICVIDDLFVMIGSTNLNRRGFFHDGECSAFAIPEQLHAAPDNPAKALRTALWAEHMGLPPEMGPALLGDPMAGFELFRRPWQTGNRFAPIEQFNLGTFLTVTNGSQAIAAALGAVTGTDLGPILWNDASDPTSALDLNSYRGPLPEHHDLTTGI